MNRSEVNAYFQLLESVLIQDNEILPPNCVFNMDESGLQLNCHPGHVLAQKGTKAVSTVLHIIGCCNAESTFLPPACIMKGKNKKPEFEDSVASNAIAGFKATGVYPYNPGVVPDYVFIQEPAGVSTGTSVARVLPQSTSAVEDNEEAPIPGYSYEPRRDTSYSFEIVSTKPKASVNTTSMSNVSNPSTSKEVSFNKNPDYTLTRILQKISPTPQKIIQVRKRAKQIGTLLTSEEHINARKNAAEKILKKGNVKKFTKTNKEKEEAIKDTVDSVNKRKAIRRLSE
ncbi:hypothetical protein K1T71_014661 [Dendrolimus kikuchii]|uniref:Uncharacterized protein n=1 Tax=Dendrolimus kikuchii TaxID=765133 RepID=A0ACC1CEM7_9NEOP|nr:hypothetical protein K1T71_014661 [Dendrolimus kikuchii]